MSKAYGVKKPSTKKTKKKMASKKAVTVYKPAYKPECKAFDVAQTQTIAPGATGGTNSISLNAGIISLAAGAAGTPGIRIGRRIRVKSVAMHCTFSPSGASTADLFLMALVLDREGGPNAPGLGDLYSLAQNYGSTANTALAHRNLNTAKRYKVLALKRIPLQSVAIPADNFQQASNDGYWEWYHDFGPNGLEVSYNNSTAPNGANGDVETNQLYSCCWPSAGAQTANITYTWISRVRFYDA